MHEGISVLWLANHLKYSRGDVDLAIFIRRKVGNESFNQNLKKEETQMKYMLLIYDEEQGWGILGEADKQKMFGEYMQFTQQIKSGGQYVAGAQLHPTTAATSVRVRDGKQLVTDGPFAETREQLGGYYLIDAKDLDEAKAIAARIPSARLGTIEVRPVVEMPAQATA
jgi:hypothetical protein